MGSIFKGYAKLNWKGFIRQNTQASSWHHQHKVVPTYTLLPVRLRPHLVHSVSYWAFYSRTPQLCQVVVESLPVHGEIKEEISYDSLTCISDIFHLMRKPSLPPPNGRHPSAEGWQKECWCFGNYLPRQLSSFWRWLQRVVNSVSSSGWQLLGSPRLQVHPVFRDRKKEETTKEKEKEIRGKERKERGKRLSLTYSFSPQN